MNPLKPRFRQSRQFLWRSVLYSLIGLAMALGVFLGFDYQGHRHHVDKMLSQERSRLDVAGQILDAEFSAAVAQLRILVQTPALQNYAAEGNLRNRQSVRNLFRAFVANVYTYDRIRLLDTHGNTVVLVATEAGRPAVLRPLPPDALHMAEGDVYIDNAPRSQDAGDPSRGPALRLIAPIMGPDGERAGIIVMHMLGNRLLETFARSMRESSGQALLLSGTDYWQGHAEPQQPLSGNTVRPLLAAIGQQIEAQDSGTIHRPEASYLFTTVGPVQIGDRSVGQVPIGKVVWPEHPWKLVSGIAADRMGFAPLRSMGNQWVYVASIVVVVLGAAIVIAWFRTASIRQQAVIEASERQLRTVLDNTMTLAFLKDHQGRYLFANRTLTTLIDRPVVGVTDTELFGPEQGGQYRSNDLKVLASGEPQSFEETMAGPDGDHIFLSVKFPLQLASGEPALCGISTEITDRKKIEESRRQAAVVFENTNEGILVTDADRHIIAVNPAFTEITGFTAEEVLGKTPRFHRSGKHDEEFYRELWRKLDQEGNWCGEIWDRHKNGGVIPLWENITAVRDEQGQVVQYVAMLSDISAIKEAEERLTYLAHHDSLTGLPNRLLFRASLEQALVEAPRAERRVAVMMLDLDRFKLVNDTLGHAAGDRLLQTVSQRLRECVRAEDTVCRLGGDEFTVILRDIEHSDSLVRIAEKILHAVEQPMILGGSRVSVGVSVGIALFPDDADNADALAMAADAAMYRAKESGKGTFNFYQAEMTAEASRRLEVETELRDALRMGQFELYYQPQVELASGRQIGLEALIRWNHPTLGLLGPDQFLDIAEESGLIHGIGEWVLREGCLQAGLWHQRGLLPGPISINISPLQLSRSNLLAVIRSALDDASITAADIQLELEITESSLHLSDTSDTTLAALRDLGIRMVIDDFGTGYSSLAQLKHLPVDKIKVAGVFVQDIPGDEDDAAIAAAVISLGQSLGLAVIAEGVETQAQLDFLRDRGCVIGQGYYFSRPLPATEVTRLLQQDRLPSLS